MRLFYKFWNIIRPTPEYIKLEQKVVKELMTHKNPGPLLKALLNKQILFHKNTGFSPWISHAGLITVVDDIYGYEVKIDGGPLIDCRHTVYGIDRLSANRIMCAAVNCAMGGAITDGIVIEEYNRIYGNIDLTILKGKPHTMEDMIRTIRERQETADASKSNA